MADHHRLAEIPGVTQIQAILPQINHPPQLVADATSTVLDCGMCEK